MLVRHSWTKRNTSNSMSLGPAKVFRDGELDIQFAAFAQALDVPA